MYAVLALLVVLPLMVAGQVVWLYFTEGDELQQRGEQQANSSVEIPAMRGTILDREGRALAINAARYELALDPTIEGFQPVASAFYVKLAALTGQSAAVLRRAVEQRSSPEYVLLARALSEEQKEKVTSWGVPGLILTPHFARRYNYGYTAGHLLGHVGAEGHGLAGLELQYDEFLQGVPGRRAVQRDRRGVIKAYVGGKVVEPRHGQNLVLTVDLVRQTIMEEELARGVEESGARWGTAVAMDPNTGAILAMANAPDYDPNRPSVFSAEAHRNRAITDQIEPGSTFKLVTAVAAVERGITALDDSIETGNGYYAFGRRAMHDTHALGTASFAEVIAQSSNIGTAKTALKIPPGVFFQYARGLGFGQPTLIDLPGEVGGRLKHPSEWSGTSLTSMAIGYEVAVTPLQLLAAYSALANGGVLVEPYVVAERRTMTGRTVWQHEPDSIRRAFQEKTARALLPVFEQVVEEGTAEQAKIEGLRIAGKTGTAKKSSGGQYHAGKYRATFVGFFPADDPAVALLVLLDEPETSIYGGAVAAPVFQRIAKRWAGTMPKVARRLAAAQRQQDEETGRASDEATAGRGELRMAGYRVGQPAREDEGRQQATAGRAPDAALVRAASSAAQDSTAGQSVMPDVRGMSMRDALLRLTRYGVQVEVEGHGGVGHQWPEPGAPLPEKVVLQSTAATGAAR